LRSVWVGGMHWNPHRDRPPSGDRPEPRVVAGDGRGAVGADGDGLSYREGRAASTRRLMSSGASPGPVDARPTSGKGGNLRTTKCPRPGRTGHGPPKAAATKRAGAHWPTLAQGRLARGVTPTGGREHQAPRSHRNAICRGDSRDTPAISGHLQPGCAADLRPCRSVRRAPEPLGSGRSRPRGSAETVVACAHMNRGFTIQHHVRHTQQ
jgi:hypothetical protein